MRVLILMLAATNAHALFVYEAKILSVYDGDTLKLSIPGVPMMNDIGLRIRGLDTPEKHGKNPCEVERAEEARLELESMLRFGKIEIDNVKDDKYFRLLGDVYIDGMNVADQMILKGLAYPYYGEKKEARDWCKK